jgi:hypothetical protein
LVYADWLDDRDDPRGPYLRAECQWVKLWGHSRRKTDLELRQQATKLDPVWVARVSRPPVGVCLQTPRLRRDGPPATEEEIDALAEEFGVIFPPHYRAFLLAHNGLSTRLPDHPDWECEILSSAKEAGAIARRVFSDCHESNRRCGLFPIGALVDGANSCRILLGVAHSSARKGRRFGDVFQSNGGWRPWLDAAGDFIEDRGLGYRPLGALCELLADWDHAARRYDGKA